MTASAPLLEFDDLCGGYGAGDVVRGVSGSVMPGEVLCIIGRNGVGKSTLMKRLSGLLRGAGRVRVRGRDVDALDASARRSLGVSYCPQERVVFDDLDVHDNLVLMRPDRDLAAFTPFFERFPILQRRLAQHAGTLSGGEKKILSFTRGLAEASALTLLDEPSEGVQWENIAKMVDVLTERKAQGHGFVVVEQNLAFAERIADRYLVMDQGTQVLAGPAARIGRERLVEHLHV